MLEKLKNFQSSDITKTETQIKELENSPVKFESAKNFEILNEIEKGKEKIKESSNENAFQEVSDENQALNNYNMNNQQNTQHNSQMMPQQQN